MFLVFSILSLLIVPSLGTTGPLLKLTAIQFDTINASYIEYSPDWSSLTTVVSACGWIKDLGSFQYPTIFTYHSNELIMMADGQWTVIFGSGPNFNIGVSKGTWFLACITWSISSKQLRYYVNGRVIGSKQTPSGRSLKTGGKLRLGHWSGSKYFGGQMMYLNFYSKELSSSDIARMVQKGMCAHIAEVDEHEASRVIKWEDLVQLERSGAATNMYVAECVDLLNEQSERRQNATLAELEKELEEVSTRLNSTLRELEEMSTNQNRTWDWDIFLKGDFLNRTFTTEDAQLLRSSWEDASEWLVGLTITDRLIKALDLFDSVEDRPWLMLYSENYFNKVFTREMAERLANVWDGISGKLVGITMTEEVIELLNHVTDKTNCGFS